ncbi:MAG TPA: sigma-70 family RNA polymerase sigma factor [bacterium (Candidatus Stahlbacteria)]|nr:sigma-70 family RNA polymerase sigma factor [Candidatus Stahlbacteria bacterium]
MSYKENESLSDEELFERISRNGDSPAFAVLIERYKDKLFNFICRMIRDDAQAEDILQEAFIKVYRERAKAYRINNFGAWLYTIARNLTTDELRRRKRRVVLPIEVAKISTDASNSFDDEILLKKKIEDTLETLNFKYREVFILRDINGLSYREIAKILKTRVGTVKSRLNRARLMMREKLEPFLK